VATVARHDRKRNALRQAGFAQGWCVGGFSLRPWGQPAQAPRNAGAVIRILDKRSQMGSEIALCRSNGEKHIQQAKS
jgi:hypothetical protein